MVYWKLPLARSSNRTADTLVPLATVGDPREEPVTSGPSHRCSLSHSAASGRGQKLFHWPHCGRKSPLPSDKSELISGRVALLRRRVTKSSKKWMLICYAYKLKRGGARGGLGRSEGEEGCDSGCPGLSTGFSTLRGGVLSLSRRMTQKYVEHFLLTCVILVILWNFKIHP